MSLAGMTGFARRDGALEDWAWAIEARSVNGRGLEIRFRGPAGLEFLERGVREAAQRRFQRGQIGVNVQARRSAATNGPRIDQTILAQYLAAIAPHVASGAVAPPRADGLLALRGVVEADDSFDAAAPDRVAEALAVEIDGCLGDLAAVRAREGEVLQGLIAGFLDEIERLADAAADAAAQQPLILRERFSRRMAELAGEGADETRIVQEAAALAIRADVREELDRLTAHTDSARALLAGQTASGRRLDFLAQEFMREANTLTAKAASPALTALGLDLKVTIDRMREQVQNVE